VTGRHIGRYPQEIESAVYFCCLEALQNATKHAGPAAHMEDRLGAVHGRLAIVSSPGNGTLISAVVPLNGAAP
jgi:signal transduction histidine kinase